jgi:hypothetical protein
MAATKLISGVLREVWQEIGHQPGGAPQVVTTGIRISTQQLSRVRGTVVLDNIVGAATPSATTQVSSTGFLQVVVANGVGGTSINWTLDVELTHSVQQALDPLAASYIAVINGVGVGGVAAAQNLSQTYAFGVAAASQTMIIDTAKGGGVVVDASTAVVTAPGAALEVRQNVAQATPVNIARWGTDNVGSTLHLTKARGTVAVPVQVQVADVLGTISFYGYTAAAVYAELGRIEARCCNNGPAHPTSLTCYVQDHAGAFEDVLTMQDDGSLSGPFVMLLHTPSFIPDVDGTGWLGRSSACWLEAHAATVFARNNVVLDTLTGIVGGGALHTILLANNSTMPVPQANQVYLGSKDFAGTLGTNLAVLAISAEEPAILIAEHVPDTLIPIRYNGRPYYLVALDSAPA